MKRKQMTVADFVAIKLALEDYSGARALDDPRGTVPRTLHDPLFVHEFGEGALVVRNDAGSIAAYLLGLVAPQPAVGYIHMVGRAAGAGTDGAGAAALRRFREAVARTWRDVAEGDRDAEQQCERGVPRGSPLSG